MIHRAACLALAGWAVGCSGAPLPRTEAADSTPTAEELIDAFAMQTWGECSREAVANGEIAYGGDPDIVSIESIPLPDGRTLALVSTRCHESAGGAYNVESSVVLVAEGVVHVLAIPIPHSIEEGDAPLTSSICSPSEAGGCMVVGAGLDDTEGRIQLTSRMHFRGLGDSGWQIDFEWTGTNFVRTAVRSREGGSAFLGGEDIGPYPILLPIERRCRPLLALDPSTPTQGLLTSVAGASTSSIPFETNGEDCSTGPATDTIDCERSSYTVVSRGDAWVLLRVENDEEREIVTELVSLPRGCEL